MGADVVAPRSEHMSATNARLQRPLHTKDFADPMPTRRVMTRALLHPAGIAADGRGERVWRPAWPGLGQPPERNGELPQTRTGARQEAHRNKRLLSRMATQSM